MLNTLLARFLLRIIYLRYLNTKNAKVTINTPTRAPSTPITIVKVSIFSSLSSTGAVVVVLTGKAVVVVLVVVVDVVVVVVDVVSILAVVVVLVSLLVSVSCVTSELIFVVVVAVCVFVTVSMPKLDVDIVGALLQFRILSSK